MPARLSTEEQVKAYFGSFLALPWTDSSIPGSIVEEIIALTHRAQVLNTYDYVDVVIPGSKGWQVKSTKESTPVTWKRAKIANKNALIEKSLTSEQGLQDLGNAIVEFCNAHARHSMKAYNLNEVLYSRCIVMESGEVRYFERKLADSSHPDIFDPADFYWTWSKQKQSSKKEQLSSLHGIDRQSGKKMWAWHGNGENQLHFSGEREWWLDGMNTIDFTMPPVKRKMQWSEFFEVITHFNSGNTPKLHP